MVYRLYEKDKKRKYNRRIIAIEQGHFTPLILSTSGGIGPECAIFVKRLAKKASGPHQKKTDDDADVDYNVVALDWRLQGCFFEVDPYVVKA